MQEFSGQVASITVVDDPSWSGSVVRITLTDPNFPFIHLVTTTHQSLFETAFELRKVVRLLAEPITQEQTPLVVWNNVTNLNLYRFLRVGMQHDDLII
jgi:hypothetical protein